MNPPAATVLSVEPKTPSRTASKRAASLWHTSAPALLAKFSDPIDAAAWSAWRRHLSALDRSTRLRNLISVEKVGRRPSITEADARRVLSAIENQRVEDVVASEAVAVARALPALAEGLSSDEWWQLLRGLNAVAAKVQSSANQLRRQLLRGELPLTLAYLFPELAACRAGTSSAWQETEKLISRAVQSDGIPKAETAASIQQLYSSWTRCFLMSESSPDIVGEASPVTRDRFAAGVRSLLSFARPGGAPMLASETTANRAAIDAAIRLADDDVNRRIAADIFEGDRKLPRRRGVPLPSPTLHSEENCLALSRHDWRSNAWHAIDFTGGKLHTELGASGDLLWNTDWRLELTRDGKPLELRGDWEETCWQSDDDADYLELRLDIGEDVFLERHILYAKTDHFLFLADAICGVQSSRWNYTSRLKLADNAQTTPAVETRETRIRSGKARASVTPLALPEWRSDPRIGSLASTDGELVLRQNVEGTALFAPLFIDFDRSRSQRDLTWRALTVAETREIVPRDQAVAFRMQAGNKQWVMYRSLADRGNRTFMGHNLYSEFYVARFKTDGTLETLIEIE